jgi:hypothetical protein
MLTQLYFHGRVLLVLTLLADPFGAAIAGATVGVKNPATKVVRTVTTNGQGRYAAPESIVGTHADHRMPQLPSIHIGSDRISGWNVFGVA